MKSTVTLRILDARLARGLFILGLATALAAPAAAEGVDREDALQIFNRDVYWIEGVTLRNPTADTPADAPLFNVVGAGMGITWGQFQMATATSRAHCVAGDGRTDVRLRLSGLIPNGVYSVFYGTLQPDSENPLCPGVERTLALISKDAEQQPDFASFVADENGDADFQGRVDGCLFDALQVFFSVIYHFYGTTYGELPNAGEYLTQGSDCRSSFGEDAMRQLLILQQW
ncbi:MAG: hypothetical protein HYV63_32945 [Candidatus Schekmanbacteria bacterium]|nr:hypothetical protein [Candidatus Schekmanbacteria bacterium]